MRAAWRSDELAKYTGVVMAIDPSGQGEDETGYAIVAYLHGQLYLLDIGGFLDGYGEETLKALAGKAARWRVTHVIDETNFGGGMFRQLLKPHLAKVGIRYDDEWKGRSAGMKEARILDTLSPIVRNHRLCVNRRVIEEDAPVQEDRTMYSFIQQFTRMCRTKGALPHEDRLDALAMACGYWTERMDRDTDKALERHQEEALNKALREFINHSGGKRVGATTYPRYAWR